MASSLQDPQMARSLWLQRRSSRRRAHQAQWRSDWTPVGLLLLLLGLLILLAVFVPSNEAVEKAKQAINDQPTGSQETPLVGVLTEH
jgi:di/tricarboxylate transporter